MKARVTVTLKTGILDPQGDAVGHSLRKLGFDVAGARVGRVIDLEVGVDDADAARAEIERIRKALVEAKLLNAANAKAA